MSYEETLDKTALICAEATQEILKGLAAGLEGHNPDHDWEERLRLVEVFRAAEVHSVSVLARMPK